MAFVGWDGVQKGKVFESLRLTMKRSRETGKVFESLRLTKSNNQTTKLIVFLRYSKDTMGANRKGHLEPQSDNKERNKEINKYLFPVYLFYPTFLLLVEKT